ncbi:MAG: tetratricopeptide repeat protein [Verrucomicrobiota bacterium]
MNPHFTRGELLLQQHRAALAVDEIRLGLAQEPGHPYGLMLLALALAETGRLGEAQDAAGEAIVAAPDSAFAHHAMATILSKRNDLAGALRSVREAIRLEPGGADHHALQGALLLQERRWEEALAAADRALALDAENESANNTRAAALVHLGRNQEAGATLDATLVRNPEDSTTHANMGWTHLHAGRHKEAQRHFREALRLDPTNEWAREGVVESLKASNLLYALLLRYFLWMNRLSRKAQWFVILGGYVGNSLLGDLQESKPALAPFILPIRIAYVVFVWLTWAAQPLFNFLLRLNKHGRLALSDVERDESTWVGACVGAALLCLGFSPFVADSLLWLLGAGMFAFLVIPVTAPYKCQPGWPRRVMAVLALAMVVVGIGSFVLGVLVDTLPRSQARAWMPWLRGLATTYAIGIFACPWITNALMLVRPRR